MNFMHRDDEANFYALTCCHLFSHISNQVELHRWITSLPGMICASCRAVPYSASREKVRDFVSCQ